MYYQFCMERKHAQIAVATGISYRSKDVDIRKTRARAQKAEANMFC